MAVWLFTKINSNLKYIIFDTQEVNLLQYYYLKTLGLKVSIDYNKNSQIFLVSNIKSLKKILKKIKSKKENNLLVANWSLSEIPLHYRKKIGFLFNYFSYLFISFQEKFENINNVIYFERLKNKILRKKLLVKIKPIKTMDKINLFNQNKHFYFFCKKIYE